MEKQKNEVLTDCSKFLKCMIFSKKHSKIKNIFSLKAWKKKKKWTKLLNVVPRKNFLFFVEKNFFFWLAAGLRYAPLQPSASVPLHSALPPTKKKIFFNKKKNLFLEQRSKLGPLLFFFQLSKNLVVITFCEIFSIEFTVLTFTKFESRFLHMYCCYWKYFFMVGSIQCIFWPENIFF